MPTIALPEGRDLDTFILQEREKNIRIIKHRYSLSREDAEDIVSDAITDLYTSTVAGKIKDTVVSLASYFTKICLNKSFRHKTSGPEPTAFKSLDTDLGARLEADRVEGYLEAEGLSADALSLMRRIVASLPEPCNTVLWAYYEDELSMSDIAALTGLKDQNSAKSTKSNCINKLKNRYTDTLKGLRDGQY